MKIFFSGIGGSGVSAIAGFVADKGYSVAGSDRMFDKNPEHPLCRKLKADGILILPQNGDGIDSSFDIVVFSTAVEKNNPDFIKAQSIGLPIKTRPEYLIGIVSGYRTVAVAGTSGKSTISGLLAFILQKLNMEPNFIGGGRVKQFITPVNAGNHLSGSSDMLVIEACESDGSIISYSPAYSIISNLDLDHHSIEETARMFKKLSDNTSEFVIAGGDDKNLSSCDLGNAVKFSIYNSSKYQAKDIQYHPLKTSFRVNGLKFEISLPGTHNLYNALACIAFLGELGISLEKISGILPEFKGIERRFDIHLNNGKYIVVDDYAHNPHKIFSLMQTMQRISRNVCYIFQPHGFGPTRLMKNGYITTFSDNLRDSDHLMLLPIYYSGGTASKDISSTDITDAVKASGKSAETIEGRDMIFDFLGRYDTYVVFGARDDSLSDFAEMIAQKLDKAANS